VGVWLKVFARAMTSGSFCWAAMLSCDGVLVQNSVE
jgi:hypothetical protein